MVLGVVQPVQSVKKIPIEDGYIIIVPTVGQEWTRWKTMTKRYIDADEGIKALCRKSFPDFSKAAKIIKEVTSADVVEVKHGRWVDETFKPNGFMFYPYKCSLCGEHNEEPSNYCPNCGAKMDEMEK